MSNPKILVVDDEESIRDLCKRILKLRKYEVDLAEDGEKAIEKILKQKYDLVITDLKMGEINGLDVIRKIKSVSPSTDVIIITGYASTETAMQAIKLGTFDCLQKPFDVGKLTLIVNRCIEIQNLKKEITFLREKLKGV